MNTLMYISALIFILGWIGLFIIGLSYKFDYDENDKRHLKSLPKSQS